MHFLAFTTRSFKTIKISTKVNLLCHQPGLRLEFGNGILSHLSFFCRLLLTNWCFFCSDFWVLSRVGTMNIHGWPMNYVGWAPVLEYGRSEYFPSIKWGFLLKNGRSFNLDRPYSTTKDVPVLNNTMQPQLNLSCLEQPSLNRNTRRSNSEIARQSWFNIGNSSWIIVHWEILFFTFISHL